jgi:uncharacterized membrane protein HdeD (DUF308 family)
MGALVGRAHKRAMTSVGLGSGPGLRSGGLLLRALARNWWMFVLRGLAAIVFGVLAFMWPAKTILVVTLLWGAFAFVDGVMALGAAFSGNGVTRRWLMLGGVVGVLAGVIAFIWPGPVALGLLFYIAAWAIVVGVTQIYGAIRLRKEIQSEWFLILSGLISIAFGALLVAQPASGLAAIAWLLGFFAVLLGIDYVLFGLGLRKHRPGA